MAGSKTTKFKAGNKGKPKGAVTKTTKQAKELVLLAIDNQTKYFDSTMESIRSKNPIEWAKIMERMFNYVMPKNVDIKTGGDKITTEIKIIRG